MAECMCLDESSVEYQVQQLHSEDEVPLKYCLLGQYPYSGNLEKRTTLVFRYTEIGAQFTYLDTFDALHALTFEEYSKLLFLEKLLVFRYFENWRSAEPLCAYGENNFLT